MKVEFTNQPPDDSLLIEAESEDEAERLHRWKNCLVSAQVKYGKRMPETFEGLLLEKETE